MVPPAAGRAGMAALTSPAPADRRRGVRGNGSASPDDGLPERATTWPPQDRPLNLEAVGARWQIALDAAQAALLSAKHYLPEHQLHEHAIRLAGERAQVTSLLDALARDQHVKARFSRLRLPPWEARRLLGLGPDVAACIFNLDGVLIGSAAAHAAAWAVTFDELISRRIERTGGQFAPFNPGVDYTRHIHGKPRLDGVRAFLASRGIRLPEGDPRDAPGAETVHGLANRKRDVLLRLLDEHAPAAFEGSRQYLEIARDAGLRIAVVSASANTHRILEGAALADLIEGIVDGDAMVAEHLRPKPAPDTLLAACRQIGSEPRSSAAFETTPAGVAAARAAGFELVVGVEGITRPDELRAAGADIVIASLAELLDRLPVL